MEERFKISPLSLAANIFYLLHLKKGKANKVIKQKQ